MKLICQISFEILIITQSIILKIALNKKACWSLLSVLKINRDAKCINDLFLVKLTPIFDAFQRVHTNLSIHSSQILTTKDQLILLQISIYSPLNTRISIQLKELSKFEAFTSEQIIQIFPQNRTQWFLTSLDQMIVFWLDRRSSFYLYFLWIGKKDLLPQYEVKELLKSDKMEESLLQLYPSQGVNLVGSKAVVQHIKFSSEEPQAISINLINDDVPARRKNIGKTEQEKYFKYSSLLILQKLSKRGFIFLQSLKSNNTIIETAQLKQDLSIKIKSKEKIIYKFQAQKLNIKQILFIERVSYQIIA